jgi:hypothetical protein
VRFLAETDLTKAIGEVAGETGAALAVAFWGTGANQLLCRTRTEETKIVLNLKMGGTNPSVVDHLRSAGTQLRQNDALHAKLYLGRSRAVVASANASANGLGLEGSEQAYWIETGVEISEAAVLRQMHAWFQTLWESSRPVSDQDLRDAKVAWARRQSQKPSLRSFTDFDVQAEAMPLIDWYTDVDWFVNPVHVSYLSSDAKTFLEDRIADGQEIREPRDRAILKPGRWVFWFRRTRRGKPDLRVAPQWSQLSTILEQAFCYEGHREEYLPCALASEAPGPAPFPATEPKFRRLFVETIAEKAFKQLLTDEYEGSWFTQERIECMRKFWCRLHKRYVS